MPSSDLHASNASGPVTLIVAGRRRGLFDFSELWTYREVSYFLRGATSR